MKRKLFRRLVILSLLVVSFCLVIVSARSVAAGGCWPLSSYKGNFYGRSTCPSHYKHANTNPNYTQYEPTPLTLEQAYQKGFLTYSNYGIISFFHRYSKWIFGPNARKSVYYFCLSNSGRSRPSFTNYPSSSSIDYNYYELHPRSCPPDQYPYKLRFGSSSWACSGTNPERLEPTPLLGRTASYYKQQDGNILDVKYEGLCPGPRRPVCNQQHKLGYQTLTGKINGVERISYVKLDCRKEDPQSEPGTDPDPDPDSDEENKTCPTVKVKINGFPFQRVKVKRKKCS